MLLADDPAEDLYGHTAPGLTLLLVLFFWIETKKRTRTNKLNVTVARIANRHIYVHE